MVKSGEGGSTAAARGSEAWSCTDETGAYAVDAEGCALNNGIAEVTEARLRSPDCWIAGSVAGVDWGVLLAGALLPEVLPLLPVGFCGTSSSSYGSSITFCGAAKESTTRVQSTVKVVGKVKTR